MSPPGYILLVDDDDDLRCALAMVLRSEGHQVVEAANGQLALNALASTKACRLVILDLLMPVMDGPTFLAHKAKSAHAATPVVIFSSSPSVELKEFAGAGWVVPKHESVNGLLAAIQRATPRPYAPAGLRS